MAAILIGDALALLLALGLAYWIRFDTNSTFFEDIAVSKEMHRWIIAVLIPCWIGLFALFRLYDFHYLLGGTQEYSHVFNACAVMLGLTVLVTFFLPFVRVSRGWIAMAWILAFLFVGISRFSFRRVAYFLRSRGILNYRTLIIGTDDEALAIATQLSNSPTTGAKVVGFVSNHIPSSSELQGSDKVLGSIDQLPALVKSLSIEELIVSTATLDRENLLQVFENFGDSDQVELRFSSGLYELYTAGIRVKEIGNVPLVSLNKVRLDPIESAVKSLFDRIAASIALIAFWPLFLIIALLIKLESPGGVIYRRRVLGRGNREFDAYKFRTMYTNGDDLIRNAPELVAKLKSDFKLKNDPRITRTGRILRRLSLDELPQLFNVLAGQMSLVGPRMITPEEAPKYGKMRMNLLTVKPGLTGLWQIRGRSEVSYDERVRLDMYYIRNYNIWLDFQIMLQTIPVVLKGRGAW
jgi:exopolysaccharide biosynthesis polyprenyl glycosylphosphotransferase